MNAPERIAIMYSQGPHFDQAVQALRAEAPDASILALIPAGYELSDATLAAVSDILTVAPQAYRQPAAVSQLVRAIRRAQFDRFVVLFPSERLRILAASSGARSRYCFTTDGRLIPLQQHILAVLASIFLKRARGTAQYLLIWINVHTFHVKQRD